MPELANPPEARTLVLNMGPPHPSTHGVLRLTWLDLRERPD